VPSDLHLDPAELRAAAAALPALRLSVLDPADLDVLAGLPGGAALVAEHDRLTTAVARAGRELADLAAALWAVAGSIESAERGAVRSVAAAER
jgi:hypothetical protein